MRFEKAVRVAFATMLPLIFDDSHPPVSPTNAGDAIGLIRRAFYFTMGMVENRENMKIRIFDAFAALALSVAVSATAQTTQYVTLKAGGSF
jgi:hypothetical protein